MKKKSSSKPAAKGKYVVKPTKPVAQSDRIAGPMPMVTPPLSSAQARKQLRGF